MKTSSHRPGYDAPRTTVEEDELDRWRIAAELVSIIRSTPPEWSVRVGVLGRWGEGKTSVLRFVEQQLQSDDVVFWFNPSSLTSLNELWAEFARKFIDALKAAQIEISEMRGVVRRLRWRKVQQPVEQLSGLHAVAKVGVGFAFGLLRNAMKIGGPQLTAIRNKLGDKRIVVLIDDLDRTDPALVPQLLLALRDILDVPGFAFVLAFDDHIVAEALATYHPAWTEGHSFLDKILDFRFPLPPIDAVQRRRLVQNAIARFCSFVDTNAIDQVEDLLPQNPRTLKMLVRNLAVLKPEVLRHDTDELNWTDILMAQLIKLESPVFFDRLLRDEVLEDQTGIVYAVGQQLGNRTQNADPNEKLKEHLDEWKITGPDSREYLIRLIEAVRARGSMHFRYQAEFASRPHRITWKEFRAVFAPWRTTQSLLQVQEWADEQAKAQATTPT